MKIIGDKTKRVRPILYLQGPDRSFELTDFACNLPLGNIPVARCGILPDDLEDFPSDADDQTYDVLAGDGEADPVLIFRGYVCGPSGRQSARGTGAGVDLIHPARDLDQMRLSAPSLHPEGVNDWSYRRQGQGRVAGQGDFSLANATFFRANGGGSLPQQVIQNLVTYLQSSVRTGRVVARNNPDYAVKDVSFQPCVDLLQKISFRGGGTIRSELSQALATPTTDSINGHLCAMLSESMNSRRSVWDTLSAAFSDFGLLLLCDAQGGVSVIPELANFRPPDANLLDGDYMVSRDQGSTFYRRVGEVVLISPGVHPNPRADGAGDVSAATVASWPPPGTEGSSAATGTSSSGATLSLLFPGWLSPINYLVRREDYAREPKSPANPTPPSSKTPVDTADQRRAVARAQRAYAHMLYNHERDKKRTFSVSGPLAPLVGPGTTARIQPFSSLKARTTGRDVSGYNREYWGYCYEVRHHVGAGDSPDLSTTFLFRNVSESDEGLALDDHPVYADAKPWTWQ